MQPVASIFLPKTSPAVQKFDFPSTACRSAMPSRKIALFSDIHGNLEALEAVLADIGSQGVSTMICLGDIVGYGPNPAECVDRIAELGCPAVVGNDDEACFEPGLEEYMNDFAQAGIAFSRSRLSTAQRDWLAGLPEVIDGGEFCAVHASLDEECLWPYVLGRDDAARHFRYQEKPLAFCGHTHRPAVWRQEGSRIRTPLVESSLKLPPGSRTLINVGSVGQPRNLRSEASYVLYDPKSAVVEFQLVPYDFTKTQQKILAAGLPAFLALRLELGR
jgi:predicted phosphodiesterase